MSEARSRVSERRRRVAQSGSASLSVLDGRQQRGHLLNATSTRRIAEALMARSAEMQEAQLVSDWLEEVSLAELDVEALLTVVQTDSTERWRHTLQQMEAESTNLMGIAARLPSSTVRSLDPDAPIRERHPLTATARTRSDWCARCGD